MPAPAAEHHLRCLLDALEAERVERPELPTSQAEKDAVAFLTSPTPDEVVMTFEEYARMLDRIEHDRRDSYKVLGHVAVARQRLPEEREKLTDAVARATGVPKKYLDPPGLLFCKKPVVIEAMRYEGPGNIWAIWHWAGADNVYGPTEESSSAFIETLEGRMECSPGDWIIKGVKGEYYPCKNDIFEATYEAVR